MLGSLTVKQRKKKGIPETITRSHGKGSRRKFTGEHKKKTMWASPRVEFSKGDSLEKLGGD